MEHPEHYYGDTVRSLFIAGAVCMALTLPMFSGDIAEPLQVSILGILIVSIAAGVTSPRYRWSATVNAIISICAVVIFESYAVNAYVHKTGTWFLFTNQILAFIFLLALYYAIKTMRGVLTN